MKSIYASKTFWVNVIAGVVAVLQSTEVAAILPPDWVEFAAVAVFVLNIILRRISDTAVRFKA